MSTLSNPNVGDKVRLLDWYRQMQLIREFETETTNLFVSGSITGTAHSCIGQEAVAVGTCAAMAPGDFLVGNHRSHGHLIARGADIGRMMAEMFGKENGYCRGLGGSMHIAAPSLGIVGSNGILAAGLPHACGAALGAKLTGSNAVAVAFFGDGAAGEGAAHEALNLAATWKLPVVFVCENNQFSLSVDWRSTRAVEDIATWGRGYGIPAEIVDGNDVQAVSSAAAEAIEQARGGSGPTLLEMKTFRRMQHSMRSNLPDVRDPAIVALWEANDPIERLGRMLRERGALTDEVDAEIFSDVKALVAAAVQTAFAAPDTTMDSVRAAMSSTVLQHPAPPPTGDRTIGFNDALREALEHELEADTRTFIMGEDIGRVGGLYRVTAGLYERFGAARIRDTPLSETGFLGAGVGAALTGLRPIVEIQFSDFSAVAFDQIVNQAAKLPFMVGGDQSLPLVIRMPSGGGMRLGAQHSQSLEGVFAHFPGLVVVMPSSPYDAKGLLAAAIQDDRPTIFLEPKGLFVLQPEPVPVERYAIELGKSHVVRGGDDVTVVAIGSMVPAAVRAARELARDGISVEVIDPRTLAPLDIDSILESVAKTSRAVVAHEAVTFGGYGGEVAAQIGERAFWDLDAPVVRVGAPSIPMPYQKDLEREVLPGYDDIVNAVRSVVGSGPANPDV
ncbi:pyruvate dehydrogenase complex E1 component subunit beta [Conexibacter sp. DBS9H8]|uniref:alpha-ketoacid dehydrogenase subunit alpha/beta n=1 Tax=Conexibacter sp. DBS9H8 TaxID=2937801 RepID=UPI00200C87A5|nr:dehydrogenase E1 component subunit alpha/beta [Conexibacter sp. DBS9H8]